MKNIIQITVIINKALFNQLQTVLSEIGIHTLHISAGRSVMLKENKGINKLLYSDDSIADEQSVICSFFTSEEMESQLLQHIIGKMDLSIPGRGSIYSMSVTLVDASASFQIQNASLSNTNVVPRQKNLVGISAILMRGEGDQTARVLLDSGTCVPVVTFGIGTGLRDKVGLWRVTIPAEKEVISGICEANDAETIMNMMIDQGQLDKPGKGFIYLYPINQGLINTKFYIGMPAHAASMEQIIYSIDELKGDTTWRRREGASDCGESGRKFLLDLVDINLYCKEGNAESLVKAAMDAGAAGATITRLKIVSMGTPTETGKTSLFPAMELCNMSVSPNQMEAIMTALRKQGAFTKESQGFVLTYPVPKACTYLGK